MLILPSSKFQKRRRFKANSTRQTPGELALVAASFVPPGAGDAMLTMEFNQPIDLTDFIFADALVSDGVTAMGTFAGDLSATLLTPTTMQMPLIDVGGSSGPGVKLTVSPSNGIAPLAGGEPWAGVSDLELPYP